MSSGGDRAASEHLNRHFGNVDWTRQKLGSLEIVATSPTEPIRAAFVQAALSELAHDIALAAGASPQDVNVMTLTQQLAADLQEATFDGNDHNNASDFTQGLQVGVCGPRRELHDPAERLHRGRVPPALRSVRRHPAGPARERDDRGDRLAHQPDQAQHPRRPRGRAGDSEQPR